MELHARHWIIALLIAVLLHAALAVALVPRSASITAEPTAILLEIGTGGDGNLVGGDGKPAGALAAVEPPADSPVTATDPGTGSVQATATPVAIPATAADATETSMTPATAERPQSTPTISDAATPLTARLDETEATLANAQEQPEATAMQANPKPAPTPAKSKPEPRPRPKPSAANARATTDAPVRTQHRAPPANQSSGSSVSQAGTRRTQETASGGGQGAGRGQQGTGRGGSGRDGSSASAGQYFRQLATWLNRHKRYPSQSRRRREQGTVKVQFTIDRNGRLLSHRILSSSGHSRLDQEVEAMLKRASPLPAIPATLNRSQLTVTIPVNFSLR
jgi:protein TonB